MTCTFVLRITVMVGEQNTAIKANAVQIHSSPLSSALLLRGSTFGKISKGSER
jgi:hypothetical protein